MKRLIDFSFSLLGLMLLSPLLLILALAIVILLGRPVIFRQPRPGLNAKVFNLYKFRSMTNQRDDKGELLPDSQRLTKFGKFLRASSLDELPELINVLKGDMSLVGPRPLLVEYLALYSQEQARRHDVKPGITGWAQVNGRNSISWHDKFKFDVWYVDNQTICLDFKILVMTFVKVIKREGITSEGQATSLYFKGNNYDDK